MWGLSLSDVPLVAWYIGVLVFLEGLLSADNALVLAVMVRHLPTQERRRVLHYGIWGAVGFRFVAVLMSSVLLKFWICKVVGGLYLLYLATSHFVWPNEEDANQSAFEGETEAPESGAVSRGFWRTVISVTMTDIAFSVDSILAAVAMADSFPNRFGHNWKLLIVYVGGVLGIITMRFVVGYFVILLERFPGLAEGAYLLVAWIGLKLLANGLHDAGMIRYHIPEVAFWSVMLFIAVISLLVKPNPSPPEEPDVNASLELFDPETDRTGNVEDETLSAPVVDETVHSDGMGAQDKEKKDDQWGHDGSAAPAAADSLDPDREASSDKPGESRR
ncbi:MAG: TerC family protein [Isosphaeraceae bacterium]